jgi:diadenosine tetraphosphate (Ap4A) HIT family hydrolase
MSKPGLVDDCVFCAILKGEEPASFVYRDDSMAVFTPIQPVNPGHVLVVPAWHASNVEDLGTKNFGQLAEMAHRMAEALRASEFRCEGINFLLSAGRAAGQAVPHVHLHVFPRFDGDGFGYRFGPDWEKLPSREDLDAMSEKVRSALDSLRRAD